MYKRMIALLLLCSCFILGGCVYGKEYNSTFKATILEIYGNSYLVEPVNGSRELRSSDQIMVPMKNIDSSLEPEVGDVIKIKYRGGILESYPGQISEVLSIKVVKEAEEVGENSQLSEKDEEEVILYNGKEYKKSELCDATLHWLELPEEERMLSSYLPPELMEFTENWGITLNAVEVIPTGMILECRQSGGEPTGELQTGSWYIVERWTQETGWTEAEYVIDGNIGWTEEAWMIPSGTLTEWEVDWEWLYGALPTGKYRIGKEIMDFRGTGDYDTSIYFAEFEINNRF